jgi:hypothetical protein
MKVEVPDIKGDKLCTFPGENAVQEKLDGVEGRRLGPDIARVGDALAGDGDAGAVGI